MLRIIIFTILFLFVARALRGLWRGILEGLNPSSPGGGVPARGVHMVRDPVCGTFVVPDQALSLRIGRDHLYFCSIACRDKYHARPGTRSGRVEGRTA